MIVTFLRADSLVIHISATKIKITLVQIFITGISQETKTACQKQQSLTPFYRCYAISIASAIANAVDCGRF